MSQRPGRRTPGRSSCEAALQTSPTPGTCRASRRWARSLGLVATLTALVLQAACAPPADSPPPQGSAPLAVPAFAFEEATLTTLREGLEAGTFTSRQLTEAYLERIEALDRQGPRLHSMLDLNPDALAIADSLDVERREGRVRGPLHGIPVVIKDNINTADGMTTTAGSLAMEGFIAPSDAFLVQRLREAGALILAKANLSEWANFRSTASSSGWSGRGGQVRNPYVLDRSPCGSSSGSGVAVAANLAPVAVGTETDGSVVCPAAINGIVGMKPTIGLVSRDGIIPIAHSQDIAGPMARTVADVAILLNVLVAVDPSDPASDGVTPEADYTTFLDAGRLQGARVGVVRTGLTGYHAATDRVFQVALDDLRAAGAVVVDSLALPHFGDYGAAEFTILLHEFRHDLDLYLAGQGEGVPVKSMAEVIAFNDREAARSMPYFGQELFLMAQATGGLEAPEYLAALETARLAGVGIDSLLALHNLDVLVAPTTSPAWSIDPVVGDHYLGAASTPAAVAGYPHITVPMGFIHELPVGISFFGAAFSEPTLLGVAYGYEQATGHRRVPRFLPSVP